MRDVIKRYDCWGVPYAIWRNEDNSEYLCGVYDIDLGYYVAAGSMDTVLWDGIEITQEEAADLVNKYTESVMHREQRRSNNYHVKSNIYLKMQSDIRHNQKKGENLFTQANGKEDMRWALHERGLKIPPELSRAWNIKYPDVWNSETKYGKENDKKSNTGSALACQGQASPVQKHDPKVCEDFHKAVEGLYH